MLFMLIFKKHLTQWSTLNYSSNVRLLSQIASYFVPGSEIFSLEGPKQTVMVNNGWNAPGGNQTETNKTYIILLSSMRQVQWKKFWLSVSIITEGK